MTLEDFNEKVIKSEKLQKQVKATKNVQEFVALARKNGVELTEESLLRELNRPVKVEIATDAELENIAGGALSSQDLKDGWDAFKFGFCKPISAVKFLIDIANGHPAYWKEEG